MGLLASLVIKLTADSAQFQQGMKKADADAKRFGKNVDSVGKKLSRTFRALGPLIAATFGVAGIKKVTEAFIEQEQAILQVEQRLVSTGAVAGKTAKELQEMAAALQKTTIFGDEATLQMQSLLLTFTNIRGGVFDEATIAVQNVAAALAASNGGEPDLKSAATQVGKALNDPILGITALSRAGIQFTDDQRDTIKALVKMGDTAAAQAVILKELETQFGGAAEAAAKGFGGSLKQLGNTLGDTMELIGGGGTGFTGLIKEVNIDIGLFNDKMNEVADSTEGNAISGAIDGLAISFKTLRESLIDMPDLPEWMSKAGAQALQQALPLPANILSQISEIQEQRDRLALPSKVTIPIGDVTGGAAPAGADIDKAAMAQRVADQEATEQRLFDIKMAKMEEENIVREGNEELRMQELQRIYDANVLNEQALFDLKAEGFEAEAAQREENEQAIVDGLRRQLDAEKQLVEAKKSMQKNAAAAAMGILSALQSNAIKNSKKGFEIAKAAAIGETVVNTYKAATGAYAAMASIPIIGPALGIAAAAAATAAGLANVSAISSQSFGSSSAAGGGSSSGGGGIGGPSFGQQQSPEVGQDNQSLSRAITINFHGFVGDIDQLGREIIPSITKAIGDGKTTEVFA